MFPIIPNHIANGSSSTSIGKISLAPSTNYTKSIWNIWTEDVLRSRRYPPSDSNGVTEQFGRSVEPVNCDHRQSHTKMIESKMASGFYAMETIPKDTKSRSFDHIDVSEEAIHQRRCSVGVDTSGYLVNDQSISDSVWLRNISLAFDTYSHNVQLEITGDHQLRLRVVKNLVIDEEIQLWFSDEILAILSIPFLTPVNILEKNCYKCIECGKTYENPNPLKIHLATKCDHYKLDDLWIRLNEAIAIKSYVPAQSNNLIQTITSAIDRPATLVSDRLRDFHSALRRTDSNFHAVNSASAHNLQNYNPYHIQNLHQMPTMHPAPMPVVSLAAPSITTSASRAFLQYHHAHHHHHHTSPNSLIPATSTSAVGTPGEKVVAAAAAQLETIVSNMGTSKQGHICIYCGKLYSRKYGLKIHIRTHTGFKPLKCKYCLRPFGDPSNLNKHIRLHVQEKSLYKCHLCSKILVRRRDLLRHMNIKHNACESNSANGSIDRFNNDAHSSRSNSVSSDVHCDLSSNDETVADNNGSDSEEDVCIDVD